MSLYKFNIKTFAIIASLILFVRVNVYSTVYTTISDGSWNNSSIWSPAKPSMSWGFNDTVIVSNNVTLSGNLSIYGNLEVKNGASIVKTNKSITIKEYAKVVNNGVIEVKNLKLDWGNNTITNNGDINLHGTFTIYEGQLVNTGTIYSSSSFKNKWDGDVVNNGEILVGNYFLNSDTYTGTGSLDVQGNFTNDWSASFNTSGVVNVGGNLINRGTAQFDAKVLVDGNFTNDWSSSVTMSDTILVDGDINNRGPFVNDGYLAGNNFTNQGLFTSTGGNKFNGNVINKDDIINSGTFDVTGNYTNKWSSTSMTNSGNFIVGGNLANSGDINNDGLIYIICDLNNYSQIDNDGNIFVDSQVTGSGNIDGTGTLCNSDGQTDPTGGAKANTVTCTVCDGTTNTLPVQLVSFEVQLVNNSQVTIDWTTASEENNDHFEVLHSSNGVDFEVIDIVNGAGNSNVMLNYQTYDFNPAEGVNYYQLKQVDFDGKTTLSEILTVTTSIQNTITLYPNPVNIGQIVNVEFKNTISYVAEIYDITGRLLAKLQGVDNQIHISTDNLSKGNYILRIIDGEQSMTKRFIVK